MNTLVVGRGTYLKHKIKDGHVILANYSHVLAGEQFDKILIISDPHGKSELKWLETEAFSRLRLKGTIHYNKKNPRLKKLVDAHFENPPGAPPPPVERPNLSAARDPADNSLTIKYGD